MGGVVGGDKPAPPPLVQPKVKKDPVRIDRSGGASQDLRRRKAGTILTQPGGLASTGTKALLGA